MLLLCKHYRQVYKQSYLAFESSPLYRCRADKLTDNIMCIAQCLSLYFHNSATPAAFFKGLGSDNDSDSDADNNKDHNDDDDDEV
jgi:hypothetical protein